MINLDKQFTNILEKYKKIEKSLNNINNTNSENLIKLNRDYADLKPIVDKIEEYKKEQLEVKNLNELISSLSLFKKNSESSNSNRGGLTNENPFISIISMKIELTLYSFSAIPGRLSLNPSGSN